MKTLILPQFPFLFPWALVCFLFPVSRRGKLETKAVSWAVLPMKTLGNAGKQRSRKPPSVSLLFDALSFHFCFLWTLWAWNENASTQTAGPARIKPLAWRGRRKSVRALKNSSGSFAGFDCRTFPPEKERAFIQRSNRPEIRFSSRRRIRGHGPASPAPVASSMRAVRPHSHRFSAESVVRPIKKLRLHPLAKGSRTHDGPNACRKVRRSAR